MNAPQVATLTIDAFDTTLTLPDGARRNITGTPADGDYNTDHIAYLCNAADRNLAAAGWARTGDWTYTRSRYLRTAPVAPAHSEG